MQEFMFKSKPQDKINAESSHSLKHNGGSKNLY